MGPDVEHGTFAVQHGVATTQKMWLADINVQGGSGNSDDQTRLLTLGPSSQATSELHVHAQVPVKRRRMR
jgi:hypothetical protein